MLRALALLCAVAALAACGSSKSPGRRYARAPVVRCLRAHGTSFATAPAGVVRLDLDGHAPASVAEIDVAIGSSGSDALARLRAGYFFRTDPQAKPFVHGRVTGNVAYAITTLPFLKRAPKPILRERPRLARRARRIVETCLARG